jgi:hypothetical protein
MPIQEYRRLWPGVVCGLGILVAVAPASAGSLYAPWANGPPKSNRYFPIAVWWQDPAEAGKSGIYPTIGAAAVGMGINTLIGLGDWPEHFGKDQGELEAAKKNHLLVIGGVNTPSKENRSAQSVASVLALAKSIHAETTLIGYNAGDEPTCSPDTMQYVPGIVRRISSFDPTRVVTLNQTAWMLTPQWYGPCLQTSIDALRDISIASFDFYPLTNAWYWQHFTYPKSDFLTVPNDSLWVQGLATAAIIHDARPDEPAWVFVEAGGDNLGFSSQNNSFPGAVTAGSTTVTNNSGWSIFTGTWLGLGVSGAGIPAGAKLTGIIDATHATMSAAATATNASDTIAVTGGAGAGTDCVASANLCVVNGNEYRPTPAQVNAEVWMSLISGANGIEYFCHDSSSDFFCMGDVAGGAAATVTQANLTYINHNLERFILTLNAPTIGICAMQVMDYASGVQTVRHSCTDRMLTMATGNDAVPGLAMVKQLDGVVYLFAQSDRRSQAGASFTYTLTGMGGRTAEIIYDSAEHYDPLHSVKGRKFALSASGQFSDVLGQNGDDYQVKIYAIKP